MRDEYAIEFGMLVVEGRVSETAGQLETLDSTAQLHSTLVHTMFNNTDRAT